MLETHADTTKTDTGVVMELDALVVGAGFSGLYMLHRLRALGIKAKAFEAAPEIGGTWYWNRYPGARCDTESEFYCFSFSDEMLQEWEWTEKFPTWSEILRYLNYVADKLDVRRDVILNTRVTGAAFDETTDRWTIRTDNGKIVSARHFVMAVGPLTAAPIYPDIPGIGSFKGGSYHTANWPHEGVDFTGKRVGLIGTGSSGTQVLPVVAEQAKHVYVFQRTPPYVTPSRNRPLDPEYIRGIKAEYSELWAKARASSRGIPYNFDPRSALQATPEEREELFESLWQFGGNQFIRKSFHDIFQSKEANDLLVEFVHRKIDEMVKDPKTAEILKSHDYPIGTKRPVTTDGYYEAFNRDNVTLVDVKSAPIEQITPTGVKTTEAEFDLDSLIYATGFDALTGPILKIDIEGRKGETLRQAWADGPKTYFGLMVPNFPNMYFICGPQSPAILSNAPPCLEQGVEWVSDCIAYLRDKDMKTIEPNAVKAKEWGKLCENLLDKSLFPLAKSWFLGMNVPGKPRAILGYIGGLDKFTTMCATSAAKGYEGFEVK